ncbi:MAG: LptE family protein [Bacteroidales bacterium]|nr:LptE family protein [Candidatus Equibacterium intestinale]
MKTLRTIAIALLMALPLTGCGIYSFSGTSIKPDVKTITIEPVVNNAMKINPSLANSLTEALIDKFKKLTSLENVEMDGDLQLYVTVESYDVKAQGVSANETVAQNRLTVTCKATFDNIKHPEESFEKKSFAAYQDYDAERSLDEVESTLCDQIIETLVEDIFNASVAQW